MQTDLTFLKPLVASVLRDSHREWTVQGFGFLRTYFGPADAPKRFRLNLWDHRFTVPNVSTIHDHPWDFTSIVIAGEFANQRYTMKALPVQVEPIKYTHAFTTLKTGVGGGLEKSAFNACVLEPKPEELYRPGDVYHQRADEIHETLFADGTVTLNERIGDTEHARVFWPWGTHWVDAMPRPATREEVSIATLNSLKRWF
jgi:hypothetical protein